MKASLETYKALQEGYRFIVHQGSSRSGKTYNILKLLIGLSFKEKWAISICSVAFPHLRRGAMRDWRQIIENAGIYDPNSHIKTEQVYKYPSGSYMEFFSVDNSLKVRGPGRDILFLNEANLIDQDSFEQLNMRTRKTVILDYNPADEYHWLYDRVLGLKDTYFIQTTYKDNPFLPIEQVRQIEALKEVDENLWRVYGLGERGKSEGLIYTHWQPFNHEVTGKVGWGLDFGYTHPAALVKTTEFADSLYSEEKLYQSHLTNPELIQLVKQEVPPHDAVYCDTARPETIEELRRAGINAKPANKTVHEGILYIKSKKWFVKGGNFQKELKSYKYKVVNDRVTEEPVKINDDLCDAARYSVTDLRKPTISYYKPSFHKL